MDRNKAVVVDFLNELLDLYEFELWIDINSDSENVFRLNDRQGANWSGIEQDEFSTLADIVERLSSPHEDYIYKSLEEREDANDFIPKDDWDLTAKRYLESDTIANILSEITAKKYNEIMKHKEKFEIKDILEILDLEEKFCKSVCQKYVNTMSKEMLLETNDKILHIYIGDEFIDLKEKGLINASNYEQYLDGNFEVEEYKFYKELYDSAIKNNIAYDLNDLELFDENDNWAFYITFEELKQVGYGFMVKDHYPLLEKYAIPEDKKFNFYNHFTLEELDDFEDSLQKYFIEGSIIYNQYDGTLEAKEEYSFNSDILRLACGLITYKDFIDDYTEHTISNFDLALPKVMSYFQENKIKNLMDYGCDSDEGLHKLSSMYKELLDKSNISYFDINTRDFEGSPGKFITTISFDSNTEIEFETEAWNGIKAVTENVSSIYENYKIFNENLTKNEVQNDKEFEYDYN